MKYQLQVLSLPTPGASSSVVIRFDSAHYLVNCGEGTQRLAQEFKMRIVRLRSIFLNRVEWDCIGGLPGMILTSIASGSSKLNVYGGPNLLHAMASTRGFFHSDDIDLRLKELNQNSEAYIDENLQVEYFFNLPNLNELETFSDPELGYKEDLAEKLFSNRSPPASPKSDTEGNSPNKRAKFGSMAEQFKGFLPETKPLPLSISYIFKGPSVPGTFDPVAAKNLGLPPGPAYAKLKRGESVTTPDGTTIHPHQCVGAEKSGAIFMIVDCPNPEYIDNLVAASKFEPYFKDQRYASWMNKFSESTQHLINSIDCCAEPIQHIRQTHQQFALSKIDSETFSVPYYNNSPRMDLAKIPNLPKLAIPASQLVTYQLEPKALMISPPKDLVFDHVNPNSKYVKLLNQVKGIDSFSKLAKSDINPDSIELDDEEPSNLPFVSTLGTGSSIPSIDRNVSCNMITVPKWGTIILDAGEGSLSQLYRHLGVNDFKHPKLKMNLHDMMCQLKLLYISHMHADHHLGVISILRYIKQHCPRVADEPPRVLMAPMKMWDHLREYNMVQELGLDDWSFLNNHNLQLSHRFTNSPNQEQFKLDTLEILKKSLGMENIVTCHVHHIPGSYGVSLRHEDGWNIVYSGDTRPDPKLVEIGQDATLLIHEATFDNEDIGHARKKRHSTVGEAITISEEMNAEHTLLTHFSQKYPPVVRLDRFENLNSGISFDLMAIRIDETNKLQNYLSHIKKLEQGFHLDQLVDIEEI